MTEANSSHLPLKLNTAGVIPPIFASSLLLLPATLATFAKPEAGSWLAFLTSQLSHGQPMFMALYASLIVFFAFFYTAIVFQTPQKQQII